MVSSGTPGDGVLLAECSCRESLEKDILKEIQNEHPSNTHEKETHNHE